MGSFNGNVAEACQGISRELRGKSVSLTDIIRGFGWREGVSGDLHGFTVGYIKCQKRFIESRVNSQGFLVVSEDRRRFRMVKRVSGVLTFNGFQVRGWRS